MKEGEVRRLNIGYNYGEEGIPGEFLKINTDF